MFEKTALDIWHEEASNRAIITLCRSLDRALGNGIKVGIITEFAGCPGTGKTQLCYQLSVNVQFPVAVGGIDGSAIFIDTNQSFNPIRLKEIANHGCKLIHEVFKNPKENFTVHKVLSNISYVYCKDYIELIAAVESLKNKVKSQPKVKLVIIDSLSYLFRSFQCHTARTRILYQLLTDLQILADNFQIAIVLTNELTTRLLDFQSDQFFVCPALGDSQGHKVGQRIILGKTKDGFRYSAFLDKCFDSPRKYVHFKISDVGIRDDN